MTNETIFTMDTSSIKYGPGSTREVGIDMKGLGATRVMVVTDPRVAKLEPVEITMNALKEEGIDAVLFDQSSVEPTDASLQIAIDFAKDGNFDGYVGVGGGSSLDTAKVANLYSTFPGPLLTYVNAPIGEGRPVPGPLKPMIGIPTTAGTGSETTGVAVFDLLEMKAKTGISHRRLRPQIGIIDPNNTATLPKMAIAACGLDVVCHAVESMTARPYNTRPAPENPIMRPSYQGANPISHVWASRATEMVSQNIVRAFNDPEDEEARGEMLLAASIAGVGFGNAGCHLPHGMSYPISGMVRGYIPPGYPEDHPIIPHGMSVIMSAPAVFRFTAQADPAMHLYSAGLLGADIEGAADEDAGDILANAFIDIMQKTGVPNGLSAIGYTEDDIPAFVEATLPQHRLTKLSPRPADADDLARLFKESMTLW